MAPQDSGRRKIYDISVLVRPGMPIYPGDPGIVVSQESARALGDQANVSSVRLGTHSGTHIDAPYHVEDDWPTLQDLDLDVVVGAATVFELASFEEIKAQELAGLRWERIERVLFKTRNSGLWDSGEFDPSFVYLAEDAARFLANNTRIRLVGIDYLSIERFGAPQMSVHRELLGHGIVVVEGLNLAAVPPGEYELICLPTKLATRDGAPARAILIG